jgi:hypothetical protein
MPDPTPQTERGLVEWLREAAEDARRASGDAAANPFCASFLEQ